MVVNEDGLCGSAPHPTVWDRGAKPKRRRVLQLLGSLLWYRAPLIFGGMVRLAGLVSTLVLLTLLLGLLLVCSLSCVLFLGSLHWPAVVHDLGPASVSYVEMLILYERWAGERPALELAVPKFRRGGRPISVSAVRVGPSIDIWRSCGLFGSLLRALYQLLGGLGRFIPCRIGADHCRLRGLRWEQYGHGLTSGPRQVAEVGFLDDLLVLFGYPTHSGAELVAGTLRFRFCQVSVPVKNPAWSVCHGG